MELLTKLSAIALASVSMVGSLQAACPLADGDLVLRAGLSAEIIYDGSPDRASDGACSGEFDIGLPTQMAIDPQTGEIYFGNNVKTADDHILIIDPATASARKFPFYGNGLAFNKDGSLLYFGLSNLMLGVWNRASNEYRKFTILPGVEGVQVVDDGSAKGRLLVGNSDYGKNILGVDTVWEVDQGDGYYAPVMRFIDGAESTNNSFKALDSMAVDGSGNIYSLTGQGKVLIRKSDGSYEEGDSAPIARSGLMQGGLGHSSDGLVYLQDTASAEVFAYFPDGSKVMVGYGSAMSETAQETDGGIISDGESIYLVNTQRKVIRVFATDGSPLASKLASNLGSTSISGTILDNKGDPLPGVSVRVRGSNTDPVTTNGAGQFSFNLPAGLYHVIASAANFGDFHAQISADDGATTDLAMTMESYIPDYLAPGLVAEVVATNNIDSIAGSSDVSFDSEGNLYSLNHSNATISKTLIDPETREITQTFTAAIGGAIDNAWAVAIGTDLNMYASSSNSGLLRLPAAAPDQLTELTVDADDPKIVRDQNGVDRMVSYVTDIDGVALMSDGSIMMTSGSGGSIIDGFPDGTVNTLIRYNPATGAQTLFSRGMPAGSTTSVFNNPDVLKSDNLDRLFVTNRGGNAVLVNTDGSAELIWPGDNTDTDYPHGLSSYTAFTPDKQGNMFFKGVTDEDGSLLRMLDPDDDHNMLVVASGLYSASGFGGFEFDASASEVYLSEWDFVLRIRSSDGRTIAQTLLDPPANAKPTIGQKAGLVANPAAKANFVKQSSFKISENKVETDAAWSKLPEKWFYEKSPAPEAETESSGGGSLAWLLLPLLGLFRRRK